MSTESLKIQAHPRLDKSTMLMGLSGWMDGGDVSTGTIEFFIRHMKTRRLARIEPEKFYVYSFPGSMEVSALFRPHVQIEAGLIRLYRPPENFFYYDQEHRLILFEGREPNFAWTDFADCVFEVIDRFHVETIYFIGSVAGVVPHTRQPRLHSSVSHKELKRELQSYGIRFTDYEGPASIVTYLTRRVSDRGPRMATLVAEIPAYVKGTNPICIEAVVRKMAGILGVQVELDELTYQRDAFEKRLTEIVAERTELAELIKKLESDYDSEVFDTMGELKDWLERQGIRLD